jgi:hypothetical protein
LQAEETVCAVGWAGFAVVAHHRTVSSTTAGEDIGRPSPFMSATATSRASKPVATALVHHRKPVLSKAR